MSHYQYTEFDMPITVQPGTILNLEALDFGLMEITEPGQPAKVYQRTVFESRQKEVWKEIKPS